MTDLLPPIPPASERVPVVHTKGGHDMPRGKKFTALSPNPPRNAQSLVGLACGGYTMFRRRKRA